MNHDLDVSVAIFGASCLVMLAGGLVHRENTVQFPFLATAVMAGFVFPQLIGVSWNAMAPGETIAKLTYFTLLCLVACWMGYHITKRPARIACWPLSFDKLVLASASFVLVGSYFFVRVSQHAAEATLQHGGQWTGVVTIFAFFSSLLTLGLVIALVIHVHRPSLASGLIILVSLFFYLDRILIQGRRAAMVELFSMLVLYVWFRYRVLPARSLVIGGIFVALLFVFNVAEYRNVMLDAKGSYGWTGAGISEIKNIDFFNNFVSSMSDPSKNREVLNAAFSIEYVDRRMTFDFGLSLWNELVHRYVPAQILGDGLKSALVIPLENRRYEEFGHVWHVGTTHTGMADAFESFWYFGFVKFFLIGVIMSRWYRAARLDSPAAQMISMLLLSPSLHAITHSTGWFFVQFVWLAAFLLPVLLISRTSSLECRDRTRPSSYGASTRQQQSAGGI